MELGHNISQRLEQKLGLSLKAQQALKLLQLNSLEISAELEEIVQANPLLEIKREDYELIEESKESHREPEDEENIEEGYLSINNIDYMDGVYGRSIIIFHQRERVTPDKLYFYHNKISVYGEMQPRP